MDLINQYNDVRAYTEQICKPLQTEDYVVQVAEFASPAKWQLAHSSWFFETFVLLPHLPDYKLFNIDFPYLFNSYYNNAGDRVLRAKRGNLTRPTTNEVYAYRKHVDTAMGQLLQQKLDGEMVQLVTLGLHHEQQHQELLLSDIKYMFGQNPLFPAYDVETSLLDQESNRELGYVKISEGVYTIGYQGDGFCFDNELGVHKVYLHDFEIQKGLVTNGEYIEFIEAGGYKDFNLWLDEGWSWLKQNQVSKPLYWHQLDGQWMHYTLKGFQKIKENDILKHISFYEAHGFC